MSKFECRCGNVIKLSDGWSDSELVMFPERVVEAIGEKIDEGVVSSSDYFYSLIDGHGITVYKCGVCHRMHIQGEGGLFDSYAKEA